MFLAAEADQGLAVPPALGTEAEGDPAPHDVEPAEELGNVLVRGLPGQAARSHHCVPVHDLALVTAGMRALSDAAGKEGQSSSKGEN